MKTLIHDDFLLASEPARILYHDHAEKMPIYDYHCHLNPMEILENRQFDSIAQAWLGGDHYKWRLMRAHGVAEQYITGGAPDRDKFRKWAEILPLSVGNPIYHWSHLELLRFFGVEDLLSPETADSVWQKANRVLQSDAGRFRALITSSHVRALCTTDDPADDLSAHDALAADPTFEVKVLPTFRPDAALHLNSAGFKTWIARMEKVNGMDITTLDDLKQALQDRAVYFKNHGCRLSDHSFGTPDFTGCDEGKADAAFRRALAGETINQQDLDNYMAVVLDHLGVLYHKLGFVMQLHMGVIRNLNTAMFEAKGADMGFDAIGGQMDARSLASLLDRLAYKGCLPKVILYSLNPADNDKLTTIAGCFQSEGVKNKVQLGSAWWYNDTIDGMEAQMKSLANIGLLSGFVGMLTDSRSALSYTRHEYFRRTLCNLVGGWIENGEAPDDLSAMGAMISDICSGNARRYFGF